MTSPARTLDRRIQETIAMRTPNSIRAIVLVVMLGIGSAAAQAQPGHPGWNGQWIRVGAGNFDATKPPGLGQQAPLTPEYQAILQASVAAQAAGGQGNDPMARCVPPGMPRMMINYGLGMEFVVADDTTYIAFGEPMRQLRRIYTDGRAWPQTIEPTFSGYSIGRWQEEGEDHHEVLAVETRAIKSPRAYDSSGIPFHADGQTVVMERMYLDPAKPDVLYDDMTVLDHALTRPWSVRRTYRREPNPTWLETICGEVEPQAKIGSEDYYVTADGLLMPTRKDQPPPDLRNFK
jgi:hypothetical protein